MSKSNPKTKNGKTTKSNPKTKSIMLFMLLIMVIAGAVTVAYMGIGEDSIGGVESIKLGLDLQGGVNIVYEAAIENPTVSDMEAAQAMIQTRLDKENYTEAEAAIEGTNRIRVDIPGVEDPQEAVNSIGAAAMLRFMDVEGNEVLTGKNIKSATHQMIQDNLGVPKAVVSIEMDNEGAELFKNFTKENIGNLMVIMLDDQILSTVTIKDAIHDGKGMIEGGFSADYAKQLAQRIEAGSLPFALKAISSSGVGAKLGMDALNTSILAGAIGFAFIMVFMIALYRVSGIAADLALIFYVAIVLIVLSMVNATLTLPGIAGILLSIGMAVDANVIIFTRIKEELVVGRSVRSAVDAGFSKAFSAILDGNVTTLIAAAVLYMMGTGLIKSFAQTLAIGIIVSMFTALVVTRTFVKLFIGMGIKKPSLFASIKSTKTEEA
ncbi:MAG: protein translocase subunit SecD [Cellulosilyticaceae bacterium]